MIFINKERITIHSGVNEYQDTLANFELDYGSPAPVVPAEYRSLRYVPDVKFVYDTGSKQDSQGIPWVEGDAILADFDNIVAAKIARENPPYPLEEIRDEVAAAAIAEGDTRILAAESNPTIGVTISDWKRKYVIDTKRNSKARKKVNAISDADDHLLDHIDLIMDTVDLILDDVEAAADETALETIRDSIPVDPRWPTWSPI